MRYFIRKINKTINLFIFSDICFVLEIFYINITMSSENFVTNS